MTAIEEYQYIPRGMDIPPAGEIWDPGKEVCDFPMLVIYRNESLAITACWNTHAYVIGAGFKESVTLSLNSWRRDDARWWCDLGHTIELPGNGWDELLKSLPKLRIS